MTSESSLRSGRPRRDRANSPSRSPLERAAARDLGRHGTRARQESLAALPEAASLDDGSEAGGLLAAPGESLSEEQLAEIHAQVLAVRHRPDALEQCELHRDTGRGRIRIHQLLQPCLQSRHVGAAVDGTRLAASPGWGLKIYRT